MTQSSSLWARAGMLLLAVVAAWAIAYFSRMPWLGVAAGVVFVGAWAAGEWVVLRRVRRLRNTALHLASDLSTRTGMASEKGELGELARCLDSMAESLELRVGEREEAERVLLARSFQQAVISALGQFALISRDLDALLSQSAMLVSQTLGVEYCQLLELSPDGKSMVLRAASGFPDELIGTVVANTHPGTQCGYTLIAGEPVCVEDLSQETRFRGSSMLVKHGVVSGVTVAISGQGQSYGLLGVHTTTKRKFTEDEVHFLLAAATVLSMGMARTKAEGQLHKLAAFTEVNPNAAMEINATGAVSYSNDAAMRMAHTVGAASVQEILPLNIQEIVRNCLESGKSMLSHETRAGGRTLSWDFHPVIASKVVHAYAEDITERLNLAEQLRQSQKMECIGQLAAGVAHDFNNMLAVIQGHAELLLAKPDIPATMRESTNAIYFAAERAANLTRQLLTFGRKSVIQPRVIDLRELVINMVKMIQRLIGENIRLRFVPPPEAPWAEADAGMIEQVIMNLCVNARDAMPVGGNLTITCEPVQIDVRYAAAHPEAAPGSFVCLKVADTGCGMDEQVKARIFEPFFTTKEPGRGTGLGLATVFGIVKQHRGWIEVDSQVRRGTTFSVYLPAGVAPARAAHGQAEPLPISQGTETILVVEDESVLRKITRVTLEDCGYKVIEAGSGVEAMAMWDRWRNDVSLLLTDMMMPAGVSGFELARRLRSTKPELKVILASGYRVEDLEGGFADKGQAAYLQKPYTRATLARTVRACLDEGNGARATAATNAEGPASQG